VSAGAYGYGWDCRTSKAYQQPEGMYLDIEQEEVEGVESKMIKRYLFCDQRETVPSALVGVWSLGYDAVA
jgi:hypothetical protein